MTGKRGIALPFTDECDALASDSFAFRQMMRAALEFGRQKKWRYLEVRGGRKHLPDAIPSTSFYGHRLALDPGPQRVISGFTSATRRAVRKAEKSGLRIDFSQSSKSIEVFTKLHGRTRRRHGLPPQPTRFFTNIQQHIMAPGGGYAVIAWQDARPVAAAIFFRSGRDIVYKFGASDDRFQNLRPSNLVMARSIERFASDGYSELDFGRTSISNSGLRHFKLGWGAREHLIEYVRIDPRRGCYTQAPDRASGSHTRLFRILPPFLSRLIGTAIYRHIA
jgi:hypothetical protein